MSAGSINLTATCCCILFLVSFAAIEGDTDCSELRCNPQGPPIRFPFRLKGSHPSHCGYPGFDLSCTHTNDTVLELPFSIKLFVSEITYKSQELRACDPTGCPAKHLRNLNLSTSPFQFISTIYGFTVFSCPINLWNQTSEAFDISCASNDTDNRLVAFSSFDSMDQLPSLLSCTKMYNVSLVQYNMTQQKGDLLFNWFKPDCRKCESQGKLCRLNETECLDLSKHHGGTHTKMKITGKILQSLHIFITRETKMLTKIVIAGAVLGSVALGLVITFHHFLKLDKAEKENRKRIRRFLEDYRALKPARYSYADIKRITNDFLEKLGEGSYGTVYKGKLSSEILVAVKVLNNSIGNGEEFINEVSTMGRIHHVNVVRLVGFCADGFRRALVYEYLSNNSLNKFNSSTDTKSQFLGWKKLQDIAIGIAKGIEYLHQGCDQRIVHFDIKPNNILLDENLNPKIADFGTAKLCSKDQSKVSMTTAKGTMGYIAPEVFSRNFGNVSHKSDVYSFGMLVLEMVGGRKNTEVTAENDCQVYFPEWIYNLLDQGEDLRIHIEEEEDIDIAKKLAIVGLWCIQWHPVDRPSMKFAVQMLEGGENLTIPPNPFASAAAKTSYAVPGRQNRQQLQVIEELE